MQITRRVVSILSSLVLAATAFAQIGVTAYQGPILPAVTPISWEIQLDTSPVAVTEAGGGLVIYHQDDRWVAADLASGATRWTYESEVSTVVVQQDKVFVSPGDTVIALSAEDGHELWRRTLEIHGSPVSASVSYAQADLLFVRARPFPAVATQSSSGVALEIADGTVRYPIHGAPTRPYSPLTWHDLVIGQTPDSVILHDFETGGVRRGFSHVGLPLWIEDGKIYFRDAGFERDTFQVLHPDKRIIVVDESTGEVTDIWSYNPPGPLERNRLLGMTRSGVFQLVGGGSQVLKYPWGGATEPISVIGSVDPDGVGTTYLSGSSPLFFQSRHNELFVVRESAANVVDEEGNRSAQPQVLSPYIVVQGDAPISRLDTTWGCAFVGRTDGTIQVIRLIGWEGELVARAQLPANGFQAFLALEDFIVVKRPGWISIIRSESVSSCTR